MVRISAKAARRSLRMLVLTTTALAALTLVAPSVAFAQSAPAASEASDSGEIVVTARRRDESLSRSPVAITAFGQEALLERAIRTDSDLQTVTPGLTIRQTQGNNSLTYSIRGQTADTFSGSPSAVITYLNEVPQAVGGASTFYDLESVQVLKGPQGTLFGRNGTGGSVLYTSARPTDEFEALLRVRAGNLELREVEGMVNIPIVSDRVLLRAAFNTIEREGYITNLLNGEDLGHINRDSARVSLTLRPSTTLENTSVFSYSETSGTNTGASYTYSVYGCGETNNGFPLTCGAGSLFSPGLDDIFGAGSWDAYLAAHPDAYAPGLIDYVNEQRRIGPYQTRHPGGAQHRGFDWSFSNTTDWDVAPNLRFRNIFGASRTDVDSEQPQLGAPFVTILTANASTGESGNELTVRSISDEFQLQGENGNLTYIVGLYVQRQESDTVWPQTYFDVSPVLAPAYVTNAFRLRNETNAIYAQATYDLADWIGIQGLRVTAGARQTQEKVTISQLERATYTFGAPDQEHTFEDPSWELGLEYQASPDWFTYIKTRGSFRSGGFNGAAPPINATATDGGNFFDSEHVRDIEAGVKYRGEAFGRPASLNVAIYDQWIDDVQRVEFPDPDGPGGLASIAVTANVPEAEVRGIEIDGSIMATDWLEIGGQVSYTDAEFTDGNINLFGNPYSYGPFGDTPEQSGVVYAQVYLPTSDDIGEVTARAEVYAQTEQYFSNTADSIAPDTRLPGYTLVSGRLQWAGIMGSNVTAALFGKNLTDEEYFVGGMTLASALGHNAAAVGEPRTYGIELSYRY